jgi:hypothetical protein
MQGEKIVSSPIEVLQMQIGTNVELQVDLASA